MQIKEGINIAFKIGCVIGTVCVTVVLFEQYFSNEDASIVLIKKFAESKNSFPAITICFKSYHPDDLYDKQYILSNTGLTGKQYHDIMMGKIPMSHSSGIANLSFEMTTIKLQYYLTKFNIKDTNNNYIINWKEEDSFDRSNLAQNLPPVGIYYQDPTLLCYSYHTDVNHDVTLDHVNFYFNISKLQTIKRGTLGIYVHYKNQLIRNMRYLYTITSFQGIKHKNSNNQLVLNLNYISIMRRREDAENHCNENLQDDDKEWMQQVVVLNGCFPPYWKTIYSRVNNFTECNTTEQLKSMSRYLPLHNERMKKYVFNMYRQPCDRMRLSANSNNAPYRKEKDILKIKFRFRFLRNIAHLHLS